MVHTSAVDLLMFFFVLLPWLSQLAIFSSGLDQGTVFSPVQELHMFIEQC
uniref:Uncharacterized protein n=1 Tax=Arundo donax TaxID=35708 RepID=A0A0A9FMY4_ARUDO